MAKALSSFKTDRERLEAIERRLKGKEKGLGYYAAVDAQKHEGKVKVVKFNAPVVVEEVKE